jgi:hypothetical protein
MTTNLYNLKLCVFSGKEGGIIHITKITAEETYNTYTGEKFLRNLQLSYIMQPSTERTNLHPKISPRKWCSIKSGNVHTKTNTMHSKNNG